MHMPVFNIKTGRDMETGSRRVRRGPDGGFCLLGIILYYWSLLHWKCILVFVMWCDINVKIRKVHQSLYKIMETNPWWSATASLECSSTSSQRHLWGWCSVLIWPVNPSQLLSQRTPKQRCPLTFSMGVTQLRLISQCIHANPPSSLSRPLSFI